MNVAKLLGFTLALNERSFLQGGVTELLGIQVNYTIQSVMNTYPLKKTTMSYHEVQQYANNIMVSDKNIIEINKSVLPCYSAVESSIHSCGGWCIIHHIGHNFLQEVIWFLRDNNARDTCLRRFPKLRGDIGNSNNFRSAIKVVFHIRNGDICLHCEDEGYFVRQLDMLQNALGHSTRLHVVFESQNELHELQKVFSGGGSSSDNSTANLNSFGAIVFIHGAPEYESVCRFLTADILFLPGSTFGLVVAFNAPNTPIIFEERRKDSYGRYAKGQQHHMFPKETAILMEDGVPIIQQSEVNTWLRTALHARSKYPPHIP